jgi:hypothetical protein
MRCEEDLRKVKDNPNLDYFLSQETDFSIESKKVLSQHASGGRHLNL